MAAATKNKRGRPADSLYADAVRRNISNRAYNPEISARAVQNAVNAEEFTCLLIESDSNLQWFFSCRNGQTKHKGIAEQLGRMMREGLKTEEQATRNIAESYYLERKSQPEIAAEIGHTKSYISKRLDKAEKGEMASTIDRYLAWKYTVPGGKSCFWAGKQEKQYMREQDARHLIFHMPELPDMSWVKKLRRMGF